MFVAPFLLSLVSNFDASVDFPQNAPEGMNRYSRHTAALETGRGRQRRKKEGKEKGLREREEMEKEEDTGEESKERRKKQQIDSPEN